MPKINLILVYKLKSLQNINSYFHNLLYRIDMILQNNMELRSPIKEVNIGDHMQQNRFGTLPEAGFQKALHPGSLQAHNQRAPQQRRNQLLSRDMSLRTQQRNTYTSPANINYLRNTEVFSNGNAIGGPATARQSMFSQYDQDSNMMHTNMVDTSKEDDGSLSFMDRLDVRQIRQRLFSRDGGACLNNDGVPFFVNQMNKERLIKNNKTLQLRTERFEPMAQSSIKPKQGSYILDRIKANERLFKKCQKDRRDKAQLDKYLQNQRLEHEVRSADCQLLGSQKNSHVLEVKKQGTYQENIANARRSRGFQMTLPMSNLNGGVPVEASTSDKETLANRIDSQQDSRPSECKITKGVINSVSVRKKQDIKSQETSREVNRQRNQYAQGNVMCQVLDHMRKDRKSQPMQQMKYPNQPGKVPNHKSKTAHQQVRPLNNQHRPSDLGENSISKCSKITIAEQHLKELGIFNVKFDSTQNIFGPNKVKVQEQRSDKKSQNADSPKSRGGSPRLNMEISLQIQNKFDIASGMNSPNSPMNKFMPIQSRIQRFSSNDLKKALYPNNMNTIVHAQQAVLNKGNAKEVINVDINKVLNKDIRKKKNQKTSGIANKFSPRRNEAQLKLSPDIGIKTASTMHALSDNVSNGSLASSNQQQQQIKSKPLWVVNRKPQSIIVNYKSNVGQNIQKLSFGDPQYKNLLNQSNKSQPDDQNEQKKENIVCIYSEQIKLHNDRNILSYKGRPTSSPEQHAELQFTEPKDTERSARNLSKMEPIQNKACAIQLLDEVNTEEGKPEENQEREANPRSPRLCEIARKKKIEDMYLNLEVTASNVIAYGMKDLKVGISPRFILQTKGEFNGTKVIKPSEKRNEVFGQNFENLNLKANADSPYSVDISNMVPVRSFSPNEQNTNQTESRHRSTSPNQAIHQQQILMNVQQIQEMLSLYGQVPQGQSQANTIPGHGAKKGKAKNDIDSKQTVLLASIPQLTTLSSEQSPTISDQLHTQLHSNNNSPRKNNKRIRIEGCAKGIAIKQGNFNGPRESQIESKQPNSKGEQLKGDGEDKQKIFIQTVQLMEEPEQHTNTFSNTHTSSAKRLHSQLVAPEQTEEVIISPSTQFEVSPTSIDLQEPTRCRAKNATPAQIDDMKTNSKDEKQGNKIHQSFAEQSILENSKSNSKIVYQKKKNSSGMANAMISAQSVYRADDLDQEDIENAQIMAQNSAGSQQATDKDMMKLNLDTTCENQARANALNSDRHISHWTQREVNPPIVEINGETSQENVLGTQQLPIKLDFQNIRIDSKFSGGAPERVKTSHLTDKTQIVDSNFPSHGEDFQHKERHGMSQNDKSREAYKERRSVAITHANEFLCVRAQNVDISVIVPKKDENLGKDGRMNSPPMSIRNKHEMLVAAAKKGQMQNLQPNGLMINTIHPQKRQDLTKQQFVLMSPQNLGQQLHQALVNNQKLDPVESLYLKQEKTGRQISGIKSTLKNKNFSKRDPKASPMYDMRNVDKDQSQTHFYDTYKRAIETLKTSPVPQDAASSKSYLKPKGMEQNTESMKFTEDGNPTLLAKRDRQGTSMEVDKDGSKTSENAGYCKQQSIKVFKQLSSLGSPSGQNQSAGGSPRELRANTGDVMNQKRGVVQESASFRMDNPRNQAAIDQQQQSEKITFFDNMGQTAKQLNGNPPKYLEKENFGLKFQFQKQSRNSQFHANQATQSKIVKDQKYASLDVSTNQMNLNIRQLCSQSRKRSNLSNGLKKSIKGVDSMASPLQQDAQDIQSGQSEVLEAALRANNLNVKVASFAQGPKGPLPMARVVQNVQPLSIQTSNQDQIFQNLQLQNNPKPGFGKKGKIEQVNNQTGEKASQDKKQSVGGPWGTSTGVPLQLRVSDNLRYIQNLSELSLKDADKTKEITDIKPNKCHESVAQKLHTLSMISGRLTPRSFLRQNFPLKDGGKKCQTVKHGNVFQKVHKGLVSSSHVPRRIDKLSGIQGSFQNKDDVLVTLNSPRQAIVGTLLTSPVHQPDRSMRQNGPQHLLSTSNDFAIDSSRHCPPIPNQNAQLSRPVSSQCNRNIDDMLSTNLQNEQTNFGERDLFILPTSIIEDLRKEKRQKQSEHESNFGLLGQRIKTFNVDRVTRQEKKRRMAEMQKAVAMRIAAPKVGRSTSPIRKGTDVDQSNLDLDLDQEEMIRSINAKSKTAKRKDC